MSTFSPGTVLSLTLDTFDALTIDGQASLVVAPTGHHAYNTQTIGHQVIGPFGLVTVITLTGVSAGTYVQGPTNQPLPMLMVDISPAQQASPTADMLNATSTLYQINAAPYTIYQSNGSALVAFGGTATAFTGLSDKATVDLTTVNTPLNTALAAKVPTGRLVNGKALSADITLSAADVGAPPTTRTINGHALSADVTLAKSDVGLSLVDNVADVSKPISTLQQAALDAKVAILAPVSLGATGITITAASHADRHCSITATTNQTWPISASGATDGQLLEITHDGASGIQTFTGVTAPLGTVATLTTGQTFTAVFSTGSWKSTTPDPSPLGTFIPVTVAGTRTVGSVLTATPANNWVGTYQWVWRDTSANISGATSNTYTQVSGDSGHDVEVDFTFTKYKTTGGINTGGSTDSDVRMNQSVGTSIVETGTGPYTYYCSNSNQVGAGTQQFAWSTKTLASSVDGYILGTVGEVTPYNDYTRVIGFTPDGVGGGTGGTAPYCLATAGEVYCISTSGTGQTGTVNGASGRSLVNGDYMRVRRSGTSIIGEVSSDSGSTWTTIHTWSGASTGTLTGMIACGGNTTPKIIAPRSAQMA